MTHILSAIEQGEPDAAAQLLPLVYDELRKLAARRLANEAPGQTLQATGSCTRRICVWSTMTVRGDGTVEGISLQRPRKRCGGFWSKTTDANIARSGVETRTACMTSRRSWRSPHR